MKEWKRGRVRLAAWRSPMGNLLEVLPAVHVTLHYPADWCRVWSLGVTFGWLRWSCGVAGEVRHG